MNAISKFEQMTGKPMSLIHFSSPFADCSSAPCSFYKFPAESMESIRQHGSIPFFSWASQATPASLDQPEFQLADVIAGTYDGYIREFAEGGARLGAPLLPPLQLGDERQLVRVVGGGQRQPARRIRRRLAPRARHLRRSRRDQRDLGLVPERRPRRQNAGPRLALSGRRIRRLDRPGRLQLGDQPERGQGLGQLQAPLLLHLPAHHRTDRALQATGDRRDGLERVRRLEGGLDRRSARARSPPNTRRCAACSGSRSTTTAWTGRSRPRPARPAPSPPASRTPPTGEIPTAISPPARSQSPNDLGPTGAGPYTSPFDLDGRRAPNIAESRCGRERSDGPGGPSRPCPGAPRAARAEPGGRARQASREPAPPSSPPQACGQAAAELLGRLDRRPADRRPAALGHVGGDHIRTADR